MRSCFCNIILMICLLSVVRAGAQSTAFDAAVQAMTGKSLPQVNLQFNLSQASWQAFVPGNITIARLNAGGQVETVAYDCRLRYRGMSAAFLMKKSFAVKLVDEDGEKLDASLLGMRSDNNWILDAMAIDRLRMRNRVCFDVWNEISHVPWDTKYGNRNGTEGRFVEVFVNGNYNGVYCLTDKIDRKLLNLRKAVVGDDGAVAVKGLLYKGNNKTVSDTLLTYVDDDTNSEYWNSFELQYPDDYPSLSAWQPLMDLIDFNGKSTDESFVEHYNEWYYRDNLIDYWIMINVFNIQDMPYKNTFLSTPDINFSHRYMLTPWDMDASLGLYYDGNYANYFSNANRLSKFGPFNRLIPGNVDSIKQATAARWRQLLETTLAPNSIAWRINDYCRVLVESGAWQRECAMWNGIPVPLRADIYAEAAYAITWYQNSVQRLDNTLKAWARTDDDVINSAWVTRIYNYLLGRTTTPPSPKLDINSDGVINSADITAIYTIILGS